MALARFAVRPVLAVSAVPLVLLAAVSGRYGYHRDELYLIDAARHLAWGYPDEPPFTPLVARGSIALFGDGVRSMRIVPAVATVAAVVLAAGIARELGGGRRAQVLAAGSVAAAGYTLGSGHLFTTSALDLPLWLALIWLAARVLRTGNPRWWVPFGVVAGVTLLNRQVVVMLAVGLAVGLAVERRWELLRSRWLLAGAVLAGAMALPNLVWQASHDWPQLEMARNMADFYANLRRAILLPAQIYVLGPLLVPLLFVGAVWLWRSRHCFRVFVWAWAVVVVITLASGGREHYPIPLTMTAGIAGAVAAEAMSAATLRRLASVTVLSGLVVLPVALPLVPVDSLHRVPLVALNTELRETVGWPQLAASVARVVGGLPARDRERLVILGASYGEAGALSRFGPSHGLPPAFSAHNGYWHWGRPDDDGASVLGVRYRVRRLAPYFRECRVVGRIDNGHRVGNDAQGRPIVLCHGLRGSWSTVWPALRRYTFPDEG